MSERPAYLIWTDEKVDLLKKLYAEEFSFSEIAQQMQISRSSIAGKVTRLGLPRRGHSHKPRKVIADRIRVNKSQSQRKTQQFEVVEFACEPVALLDLKFDQCRWPIGDDPREMKFCAAPVHGHYSYCGRHCRAAYRVEERREAA